MIQKFWFTVLILFTLWAQGQEGTQSPYSFYGIGLQKFKGTVENRSMGGLRMIDDGLHLTFRNPASYANLQLTTLTASASFRLSELRESDSKNTVSTATIDYLAIGIPAGKFGIGFGLMPYTSVGYSIVNQTDTGSLTFDGQGGMNRVFLGLGYNVFKGFSIGAEVNYNFGTITNRTILATNDIELGTREILTSELRGLNYLFSASYQKDLSNDLLFSSVVTATPSTDLTVRTSEELVPFVGFNADGGEVVSLGDVRIQDLPERIFDFPIEYTAGVAVSKPEKWALGAEVTAHRSSRLQNVAASTRDTQFRNGFRSAIGGYYIPQYNSLTSYWKRVIYRAGFRYEETPVVLDGQALDEFGISFGLGIPVPRLYSNINIGTEFITVGTTNNGLIKENRVNIYLSLSLSDRWFVKQKYN